MGHLINIWFLKPNFMKYDNWTLIWKVILFSCTLSQLHFLCQDCPSRSPLSIKKKKRLQWWCRRWTDVDLRQPWHLWIFLPQQHPSLHVNTNNNLKSFLTHLFYFPSSFVIFFVFWVFPLKKERVEAEPPCDRRTRWASTTGAISHHQLPLNRSQNPPSPLQLLHIFSSNDFQL